MWIRNVVLVSAAILFTSACAPVSYIQLSDTAPLPALNVRSAQVNIVDLTKQNDEWPGAYGVGLQRISDKAFVIPPGKMLVDDLTRLVRPSGTEPRLDVWVIDVSFFWDKPGATLIPILGMLADSSGAVKCEATINRQAGGSARKFTIDHTVPLTSEGVTTGEMIWKTSSRQCYPKLLEKVLKVVSET